MNPRQEAQWLVTAGSQHGSISYEGRSVRSSVWRGGAAYVQMCLTCGLEPSRPGFASNCMCMCGLGKRGAGCSSVLNGNGDADGKCNNCGTGRPKIPSIGTIETKAKRPRSSYVPHVLRPGPSPLAVAAAARVVALAASVASSTVATYAAGAVDVPACRTHLSYGHFRSCSHL
jgi:hypothetical protein